MVKKCMSQIFYNPQITNVPSLGSRKWEGLITAGIKLFMNEKEVCEPIYVLMSSKLCH